ncbi:MAG: ORF6N domain-containing protein, partial [Pedobacter sp.]
MTKKQTLAILSDDIVVNKIYVIRNQKVMLDSDLAELYGVETKVLNQSIKRNAERFPEDFMFQLSESEWQSLRSQ